MKKLASALLTAALVAVAWQVVAHDESHDVYEKIAAMLPGVEATDIHPTPLPGLYEVSLGSRVVYVSEDAKYLINGSIIEVATKRSLTEERQGELRAAMLRDISEDEMIVFSPARDVKHSITVFTDIDCTYCRRLHNEMNQLNDLGIEVRYMFFPRSGPDTVSWSKADAVWCSDDQLDAMTRAKAGKDVEAKDCGLTPVGDHFLLGRELGVSGTPAIIFEDGNMLPGYLPAPRLAAYLDGDEQ